MTDTDEAVRTTSEGTLGPRRDMNHGQFLAVEHQSVTHNLVPASPSTNRGMNERSVAIIDSHCLTRECIANNVSNAFGAIEVSSFLSINECNNRKSSLFSLIILYLHASEYRPLELIKSLSSAHTHSTVFLISDLEYHARPEFLRAAWRLGARGFISTRTTSLTLALSAIRFVQAGGFFAPVDALLSRSAVLHDTLPAIPTPSELTARETIVLSHLKEGKTNKIIARELQLSSNTVKVHVHNILRKMQAANRTEAASKITPPATVKACSLPMLS